MFEFVKNYGKWYPFEESQIYDAEKKWGLNFPMNSKHFMKR